MEVTVRMQCLWRRARRYVVKAGYIVPEGDQEPFDVFDEAEKRMAAGDGRRPHEELAWLDLSDAEAIAAWCTRWGPLGILPHELVQFRHRQGVVYERERGRWRESHGWDLRAPREYVLARSFGSRHTDWRDPRWVWQFFPDRQGDQEGIPPLPLSDEFWALYREPIDHFVSIADTIRRALSGLTSDDQETAAWAVGLLDHELTTAHVAGSVSPDAPDMALQAPTLLAAMVSMLQAELRKGHRIGLCHHCGRPFVAASPREKYHSPACRVAHKQGKYMRRRREAVRLHREGLSANEIAAQLNADPAQVARWIREKEVDG